MHAPVCRPGGRGERLQVADIFRRHGGSYAEANPLSGLQRKVLTALMRCRTAALGGHVDVCSECGYKRPSYNSCRNRHCPNCQVREQDRWIEERRGRILNTHYFHVVFTLPDELRPVAKRNPRLVYDALFAAASETLITLGRQSLGATLGITMVLHTWTRALLLHPHVHCVVTGGGLALDGTRWAHAKKNFLFPVAVMRKLFRGKLLARLDRARQDGRLKLGEDLDWTQLLQSVRRKKWVVFAKRTFGGPQQVFEYLGRYTHRVGIASSRLLEVTDDTVRFRTRGDGSVTVRSEEFIRRFLLHVLPPGFRKIRHYGLVAPSNVPTRLKDAQQILGDVPSSQDADAEPVHHANKDETCPICLVGPLRTRVLTAEPDLVILPRWRDTS